LSSCNLRALSHSDDMSDKLENYEHFESESGGLVKSWTRGVPFESEARRQLARTASLPFIHKWVAAMPDVHVGIGATVGSVVPTKGAIIPAAVGVDIGCGMIARKTSLTANDLPDSLTQIRNRIERLIPVGEGDHSKKMPAETLHAWKELSPGFQKILDKNGRLKVSKKVEQLGTLGGGNHFIELCLDEAQNVWIMLHSGSRGVGNLIGRIYIELAKNEMERLGLHVPDRDLSYFKEGSKYFHDYVEAVEWAQNYARLNRDVMMTLAIQALRSSKELPPFTLAEQAVNCHHNYVEREQHFGEEVYVTRKGAVRARKGELGIIPGSMGAKSFIVRGKGNAESFCSCSHGAGRVMSRTQAKELISLEEHREATRGVECRKDTKVLDESPRAYKDIDLVMKAQSDLVEIVHTLKQVVCVKG
jgi:tRNA-splicing ligase RtcB (3'-phosphate/5'-hydroxy nucleic acid ligase)